MAMNPVTKLEPEGGDAQQTSAIEMAAHPMSDNHHVQEQKPHDNSVTFEEYLYWAKISRADERYEDPSHDYTIRGKVIKKSRHPPGNQGLSGLAGIPSSTEVSTDGKDQIELGRPVVSNEEWVQASRAVRTASWGAVFYLITTDILGPFGLPYAFAAMGYGPGVVLFTIFGVLAAYGGFLLWRMFLALDSDRYPLRTYGDIAHRILGSYARHFVNFLQSTQLLLNVGIIVVGNGLSLEQIVTGSGKANICFILLCFVWAMAGMLLGQVRTLKNVGWLAHAAIWLNIFVIIMTMAVVPSSGIQAEAAIAANAQFYIQPGDPIKTSAGILPGTTFITQVNGFGQSIFAYGGAMLFVEFMAEMKKPFDFWKGMIFAQLFIYICYMFFGLFVYSFQGQYTLAIAYQGIGSYIWQTVANSIGLIGGLIAALLYGNIGLKVIYNNVLMDIFGFPGLNSRTGKIVWIAAIPIYWAVAFILASAIPQVTNLTALLAALCILQFSYTFPCMFIVAFFMKRDAMIEGEGFNPVTGETIRIGSTSSRLIRGYMKKPLLNSFNVFLTLGCLVCAILGLYSSVVGIQIQYASGAGVSFSCNNPYAASG